MSFAAKCFVAIMFGALLALGRAFTLSSWRRERLCGWTIIVYIMLVVLWQVILFFRCRGNRP